MPEQTSTLFAIIVAVVSVAVTAGVMLIIGATRRRRAGAGRARTRAGAEPAGPADSRGAVEQPGYSAGVAVARERNPIARRATNRLFGRPSRVIGLDAARGAALAALFLISLSGLLDLSALSVGLAPFTVALDRIGSVAPAALVVISGAVIGVTSGGSSPLAGIQRVRFRMRSVVRALIILTIGALAAFSNAPWAGLAAAIGVLILVALIVLGWRARRLFVAAAVWTIAVPIPATVGLQALIDARPAMAVPFEWLAAGPFPPLLWVGLVLAGLAVGRLNLEARASRWILLAGSVATFGILLGVGTVASGGTLIPATIAPYLSIAPASNLPLAILGVGAAALGGIALLLLAGTVLRWLLFPFSAVGSLGSTLWISQLLLVTLGSALVPALVSRVPALVSRLSPVALAIALAGAMGCIGLVCVIWRLTVGDGPVERLLRVVGAAAASTDGEEVPHAARGVEPISRDHIRVPDYGAGNPPVSAGDFAPRRRPVIDPADPVAAAAQWTPGQALGRMPY